MDLLGKRLVRSLTVEHDLSALTRAGVTEADIFDDGRVAFDWMLGFVRSTGNWPTGKQVEENTKVELPDVLDKLEYVTDLVRKRSLAKQIEQTLTSGVLTNLENRNPDEALRLAGEMVQRLRPRTKAARVSRYREGGLARVEAYRELRAQGGLLGLPTPWKTLNEAIQGWVNGTFNVITAMQSTGKTWICCVIAEHALSLGAKVLFITLEMATARVERRIDALRHKIPWDELRDTTIDLFGELRWEGLAINDIHGKGDILIADKQLVKYVSDATALVMDYKPDLIVIDGGYRFQTKGGSPGAWESTVAIVNELQDTSEATGIPWVVTTQQGEGGDKLDNQKRAYKVRYGKEWVINPDNVIEAFQDGDLRLLGQMELRTLKIREAAGERDSEGFRIFWDHKNMSFGEVPPMTDASVGVSY
jgi:hypothetical protein